MFTSKQLPTRFVLSFASRWLALGGLTAATVLIAQRLVSIDLAVPFLPIATVGTAVAFYLGFKNNSSYDRYWEARKIWGGVVNTSRTWANQVLMYAGKDPAMQKELVRRQIAWAHALRLNLRKKSRYEGSEFQERNAPHIRQDWDGQMAPLLDPAELAEISAMRNPVTHLARIQGQRLKEALEVGTIDLFHQIELGAQLTELYALQGKCERIKNTPFPRQYANFSRLFVWVFIILVPVGLLDVFGLHGAGPLTVGLAVKGVLLMASNALISWMFMTMELIGDGSEDPFERGVNDVCMTALCLTIQSDLLEMIGEEPVEPLEVVPPGILF